MAASENLERVVQSITALERRTELALEENHAKNDDFLTSSFSKLKRRLATDPSSLVVPSSVRKAARTLEDALDRDVEQRRVRQFGESLATGNNSQNNISSSSEASSLLIKDVNAETDFASFSYKKLQQLCKDLGFSAGGKKELLVQRLNEHFRPPPAPVVVVVVDNNSEKKAEEEKMMQALKEQAAARLRQQQEAEEKQRIATAAATAAAAAAAAAEEEEERQRQQQQEAEERLKEEQAKALQALERERLRQEEETNRKMREQLVVQQQQQQQQSTTTTTSELRKKIASKLGHPVELAVSSVVTPGKDVMRVGGGGTGGSDSLKTHQTAPPQTNVPPLKSPLSYQVQRMLQHKQTTSSSPAVTTQTVHFAPPPAAAVVKHNQNTNTNKIPSPSEEYRMSSSDSDDEDEDDENKHEKDPSIPRWAKGEDLLKALTDQYENPRDPDQIFPDTALAEFPLEEIFKKRGGAVRPRSSSAIWTRDGVSVEERLRYREDTMRPPPPH